MKTKQIAYGLDLALRHGALVKVMWDFSSKAPKIVQHRVVYEWASGEGLNANSSPLEIRQFCLQVYKALRKEKKLQIAPIAIDWDANAVFWGARKPAVILAMFAGYLAKTLELLGFPVVFISPAELRRRLGGNRTLKKGKVWALFPDIRGNRMMSSDLKDALVLSFLVARSLMRDTKKTSKANLPSSKAKRKNT